MIREAYNQGCSEALRRFGVREASVIETLLGLATPIATRAGLNVFAPNLMSSIEKKFEVPFRALKGVGQGAVRAIRGPSSPAEALVAGLSGAPAGGGLHAPMHVSSMAGSPPR